MRPRHHRPHRGGGAGTSSAGAPYFQPNYYPQNPNPQYQSNPQFYQQQSNPRFYFQNPNLENPLIQNRLNVFPQTPNFQSLYIQSQAAAPPHRPPQPQNASLNPKVTMERVESAAAMSQRDLATAGENVTAWKVSQATLVSLQVDSWSAVGFQLQEVPTLCRLLAIEGKINAFIHCFVGVQSITTVYDLEVAICKNEGIERFEELGMGPLSRHPLVQHYFFVGSDSVDIFKISAEDVIASLHSFLMHCKRKTVSAEELLDFLAEQKSLPHKQKLGVRIQNLGLHVAYIRRGEQSEKTILNKSLKGFKHKLKERSFRKGQTKGQTKKKKRKRRENHDNTMNKFMRKEEMIDVKRQSDSIKEMIDFKRQSDSIIIVDGYIEDFLTTWKEACREHSAAEVLDMMINFYMTSSTERKKRQIQMIFSTLPGSGLLNVARSMQQETLPKLAYMQENLLWLRILFEYAVT